MARPTLRLALLVVLAVGVSVGTTGFSAVDADRSVAVNVVDDDEAYVGVVACERPNGNETGADVRLWVENRNSAQFTVETVTSADANRQDNSGIDEPVPVGDRERIDVTFDDDVEAVTVEVDGTGVDATISRDVTAKDDCPYSPDSNGTDRSATETPAA